MSNLAFEIDRIERDVGELVARHARGAQQDFSEYADDPVGFARNVLKVKIITDKQVEMLESARDNARTVVLGCNGAGKDSCIAMAALWFVYARRGLVLLTGPTERQVRETMMRREVRRLWSRCGSLAGDLFEMALRIDGQEQTGILAFTATDPDSFTGHHAPALMVCATEAQGIDDEIFEAALACLTGEQSRLLVVGNPLRPRGRFFEISRGRGWHRIEISAFSHPNIIEGREVIPGAVTREFVSAIEQEYGKSSPQYLSRVLAKFPEHAADQLIRREWIDRATERWRTNEERGWSGRPVLLSGDVARFGADQAALATVYAAGIRSIAVAAQLDTIAVADFFESGAGQGSPEFIVDETGLGGGAVDVLRSRGRVVCGFVGAASARRPERFANCRAEAAWNLRELLERNEWALPPDELLRDELLAMTWSEDASGRIILEPKEDIARRLKRSPDRADSAMMAAHKLYPSRKTMNSCGFAEAMSGLECESPWRIE